MHARRRDRDDGHVPLLQGGDLDYRSDLRKSQNVPCWPFFPASVWVHRLDWTAGTIHGYWHRTSDGTGAKIGAGHMRATYRNRQSSYGLLRSTTRSPARPSSVYRTVSSQPRLRSIIPVPSSWSSGWFFGSAAAVALILLVRLSVPFLLLLRTGRGWRRTSRQVARPCLPGERLGSC
jgi:hypothetical protein